MAAHGAQQDFLTNEHNKNQFIVLLMEALETDGHCVKQAEDDADTLIVSSALDLTVNIVADDTGVFVMMIYHFSSDMHDMYFFSEAAARSKKAMRYIGVRGVQQKIGCDLARRIIFLHGWSGCDTSAVFGQGKGAILKLIATSRPAQNIADMFMSENTTQEDISTAGLKLFVFMYNGSSCDSLNNLRFTKYMNLVVKSQQLLKPEVLPPTERAAHYHCLRVYLQVMRCVTACDYCHGHSCENGQPVIMDNEEFECNVDDIFDV